MAMDYSRFYSEVGKRCESEEAGYSTRAIFGQPGDVNFGLGNPNIDELPFQNVTVQLKNGETVEIDEKHTKDALKYVGGLGYPPLVKVLREFVENVHNPPTAKIPSEKGGLHVRTTLGNTDGVASLARVVLNPGDYFLVEEPKYGGTCAVVKTMGLKALPIDADMHGVSPESLRKALSPWKPDDAKDPDSDIPKLMYLMPTISNPQGGCLTDARRREIYKIAQDYNILIVEDDAYYFLNPPENAVPSFLSLDVDGRVIRCDSFSKVLGPGLRVGYVSGPSSLLKKMDACSYTLSSKPSTFTQVLILQLFRKWGMDGFLAYTKKLADFYTHKVQVGLAAAEKYLTGLATWVVPTGGMYLWIKTLDEDISGSDLAKEGMDHQVVVLGGDRFVVHKEGEKCQYVRATICMCSDEEIELGIQRLAEALKSLRSARLDESLKRLRSTKK